MLRQLFTGDNLDILRGLNSDTADLVYLDPPFNSNRNYAAPIGTAAEGAEFKDVWTLDDVTVEEHGLLADQSPALYEVIAASRVAHGKGMQAYLTMMGGRLLELRRVMKPTASIYLHCDPTASHYLKMVMDCVFGKGNFRNEVVWAYTRARPGGKQFARLHDIILYYSNGERWTFDKDYAQSPLSQEALKVKRIVRKDGSIWERKKTTKDMADWWTDIKFPTNSKERTGWATQKPLALLERIIQASSQPGDLVLDPFCGCATACLAAEKLGRQWIGIDLSPLAQKLVKSRLSKELGLGGLDVAFHDKPPVRTDLAAALPKAEIKHILYGAQKGDCAGCEVHFPFRNLTIDRIVPGGEYHQDNTQLLCGACNSVKGKRSQAEFLARLKDKGLRE